MSPQFDQSLIFVPAYNVATFIPTVLDRIPAHIARDAAEILVVDNCSQDGTGEAALESAARLKLKNLRVLRNARNLGYGGSQKVAYATAIRDGRTVVAMLHGDAQYAPEHLERLIEPVASGQYDMVFGSRMAGDPLKGGMPLYRFLGNRFLTTLQNLVLGTRLTEFHPGYRVYSVSALSKIPYDRLSNDYHFDTEIIVLLLHHGLRIGEVPIPTHYGDEPNYVNVWKYGTGVLVTTGTYFLHRLGLRRSKRWKEILGNS